MGIQQKANMEHKQPDGASVANEKRIERAKQLSTNEAYFNKLAKWRKLLKRQQLAYLINNYNHSCIQLNASLQQTMTTGPHINWLPIMEEEQEQEQEQEAIYLVGAKEFRVAPFWKRIVAELIDGFVIIVMNVILVLCWPLVFLSVNINFERTVIGKAFDDGTIWAKLFDISGSLDSMALTYELITLLLISKLFVCLYESLWTNFNMGATPGKSLLHLRVVYVEAMVILRTDEVHNDALPFHYQSSLGEFYPGTTPSFRRSLVRAFIKNVLMFIVAPIFLIIPYIRNNQTTYDSATQTFVVEVNSEPLANLMPIAPLG